MSLYAGIILLTELLMFAMSLHVLFYSGFTKVQKRWYLLTFLTIMICAGAEYIAKTYDMRGESLEAKRDKVNG